MRVRVFLGALKEIAAPLLARQGSQRAKVMLEKREGDEEA